MTNPNDPINATSQLEVYRIHGQDNDIIVQRGGLSKREYFAIQFASAFCSDKDVMFSLFSGASDKLKYKEIIAKEALIYTDALIAELNKKVENNG